MRWVGLVTLLASPAFADPALISFTLGTDSILASGADIRQADPSFDLSGNPAVRVRLHPGFDARFAEMTRDATGQIFTIRICGEVIVEPVLQTALPQADFILRVESVAETIRLADILKTATCPGQPSS